jgi:hypothetical protein
VSIAIEAPPVTCRDVLHRTADLIEEFGHQSIAYGNREIGFCLVGSLVAAEQELGLRIDRDRLKSALSTGCLIAWNLEQTKEGVVSALRGAA